MTRTRKGLLALAVLLLSVGAAWAGGQNDGGTASGEKITLNWMVWSKPDNVNNIAKALYAAYPEYQAKYDNNIIIVPGGASAELEKFRLMLAANEELPDVIQLGPGSILEFAVDNVFADLGNVYKKVPSDYMDVAKSLAKYNGKFIGFVTYIKTKLWYYRTDMYASARIDPNQVKTVDDFIAAGKKLQSVYPKSYMWNLASQIGSDTLELILSGNGGRFADEKGNYIVDKDPGVRAAFVDLKRLADSGVVARYADFTPDWQNAFVTGELASTLGANWTGGSIAGYVPDQAGKWSAAQWPEIGGGVGGSESGGQVFLVPDKAPHKAAAIDVLTKATLTKEGTTEVAKAFAATLPLWKGVTEDQTDPFFGASFDRALARSYQDFKVFPYTLNYRSEGPIICDYLSKYVYGGMDLDIALRSANQDLINQFGNSITGKK